MYNNNGFKPKGRGNLPTELLQMGRHLVYAEGTRTEPYYVENIKNNIAQKYQRKPNEILLITANDGKSRHTKDLVEFAIEDAQKQLQKGYSINHVWILFDKDDFTDFEEAHRLINSMNDSSDYTIEGFKYNKNTGISWHSCWSNQCFELWLCLYFSYYNTPNNRDKYKDNLENNKLLKKVQFKYEKNLVNIHDILTGYGGSIKNAISYAKKLEAANGIGDPSTGVYQFAEYFQNYMK